MVVVVVLAGLLLFRQVDRWRGQVVTVWVPLADIPGGTRLSQEQLTPIQVRQRALPEGAVVDPAARGRSEVVRPKAAGAIFVAGDLKRLPPARGPGLLAAVPEGYVLMAYKLPGLPISALAPMLRQGDRFDIFAGRRRDEPLHMAHDVVFLGWIRPPESEGGDDDDEGVGDTLVDTFTAAAQSTIGDQPVAGPGPTPLLLGVRPEDVRRLVWASSARLAMYAAFHGRLEAEKGELLPIPAEPRPRADQVELILGWKRKRVSLTDPQ